MKLGEEIKRNKQKKPTRALPSTSPQFLMIPNVTHLHSLILTTILPLRRNNHQVLMGHNAGNTEACLNNPEPICRHKQL